MSAWRGSTAIDQFPERVWVLAPGRTCVFREPDHGEARDKESASRMYTLFVLGLILAVHNSFLMKNSTAVEANLV